MTDHHNRFSSTPGQRVNEPVLVVGTGALACLFAARLAEAGVAVTMLGTWPEGLEALHKHGVRLVGTGDSEKAYAVVATADPAECVGARTALVLVKSWQTERAARQLAECLSPQGLALTLQNGLGNREKLVGVLGEQRVALGVTDRRGHPRGSRTRPPRRGGRHLAWRAPPAGIGSEFAAADWPDR